MHLLIKENFYPLLLIEILTLSFAYLLSYLIILVERNQKKKDYLKNLELSIREQRENYINALAYKHDIYSVLIGLKEFLNTQDIDGASNFLSEIFADSTIYFSDYNYTRILEIRNAALRAILLDFLIKCEKENVIVKLKLIDSGNTLGIPLIDLVKSLSILLNNSFEAVSSNVDAEIHLSFVNTKSKFEFSIENDISIFLNLEDIMREGYSTKKNHSGFGLSTLQSISSKYRNFNLIINIENNKYIAKIIIE